MFSVYQLNFGSKVEGGADEGGKGKNIWDTFTSQPGNIDDGSSGEVGVLHCNLIYISPRLEIPIPSVDGFFALFLSRI